MKFLIESRKFITKGNVIGLAVAVITVNSFVGITSSLLRRCDYPTIINSSLECSSYKNPLKT
ncbi:MAG: hypothetical protein EBZ95_00690 [Chitinophagia bacterium]|nr:hypothetical protein [Chitinophagia bacterium]